MRNPRYILVHTGKNFVAVMDTEAPKGAQYVQYWNDEKHLPEATQLKDKLNTGKADHLLKEQDGEDNLATEQTTGIQFGKARYY